MRCSPSLFHSQPDMTGIEENVSIFGDWAASNPSPRTFRSSFFNGDAVSRAFPGLVENGNQVSMNTEFEKQTQVERKTGSEPVVFNVQKSSAKVALGERMAARVGFSPFARC
ncbi:hypothetical protein HPP92_022540 [Vanilla planifolia]|uniref:Uncharacterized protein n=1 Tax=Vanilla planifolia TaxID=51239 RepID=A0A835UF68_VANPL|nr:hypothetical protein HPP92_022540 [Vanilla planifolia]